MDGEGKNGFIQREESQELLLKCPRCDSLNTKFCFFNNYSQSQPRYFCKACRRSWNQGGTLRNVPIGGGCRKGKRARLSSSRGETVRSPVAAPIAPAPQQPAPVPLGIRESGPMVPAFVVDPTMAFYYPGEDVYLSTLLSNNKSLSVGSDAAGNTDFSLMTDFNVHPFSYQQQQNFMNDANHTGSVSDASVWNSNQWPRIPKYDPSP